MHPAYTACVDPTETGLTYGIEFHDTWLKDLRCNGDGTGFALLHASVYQSEGMVFKDAQLSGWQNIRFSFEGMRIEGEVVELNQYASDGELWIDGKNDNGTAMLPADHEGDICLELCLAPEFNTIKIHATSIRSEFEGEFELEAKWDDKGDVTTVG
jgi:hypothetical protein